MMAEPDLDPDPESLQGVRRLVTRPAPQPSSSSMRSRLDPAGPNQHAELGDGSIIDDLIGIDVGEDAAVRRRSSDAAAEMSALWVRLNGAGSATMTIEHLRRCSTPPSSLA